MASRNGTVVRVKASALKPPRHGARSNEDSVDDVRASVSRHGQLQPVIARPDGEVIIGEQRRRSRRPDEAVHVLFVDVDEVAALEMRLSEECAKSEQSPAERAEMVAALAELLSDRGEAVGAKELAARVGLSASTVARYLRVAALPKPVKALVSKGDVGYREALALSESSLPPAEKTRLARKFASGSAPGGSQAREVVEFVEHAPTKVRERFVTDRRTTFDEAQRAARRHQTKEYRQWLDRQSAQEAGAFFVKVVERIRSWIPGLNDVAELAAHVPVDRRPEVRRAIDDLARACSRALAALDKPHTTP